MEEVQTGVEVGGEAGSQVETQAAETGVETGSEAGGATSQGDSETAWAKRLASIKEKTEKETAAKYEAEMAKLRDQYKDYDDIKSVADYFRELNQAPDVMTLKERIEMERLQQRADQENVPVEVLKRLNELEAKAAEADKLKQQQEEQERTRREQEESQKAYQEFRGKLDAFAKEKDVDADQLYSFMVENQTGNMEVALKAMRHDELEQKLAQAEKNGVKKFLQSKSKIPTVPGTTQSATKVTPPAKSFAEARQRAMQRLSGE